MPRKKYSTELKLQVVQDYLNGNEGKKQIAKKYYTTPGDVQKWMDAYREHGVQGLCTIHGTYTGDFKLAVVQYMQNTSSSARQTAALFNIPSYTTVCKWERIYLEEGSQSLFKDRRGRPSIMNVQKMKQKSKASPKENEALLQK